MTRMDVEALLGEPSRIERPGGGSVSVIWERRDYTIEVPCAVASHRVEGKKITPNSMIGRLRVHPREEYWAD
jgi:hypothetical protein